MVLKAVARGFVRLLLSLVQDLNLLTIVDIQLYAGRNLDTVTQVEIICPFFKFISQNF